MPVKTLRGLFLASLAGLLGGCHMTVLSPVGRVAQEQRDLLLAATVLMLIIIVPLFIAIVVVAVHYRQSNTKAAYAPEWEHSTKFELLIWAAPLAIIVALGAMTWIGTHLLDPYHPVTATKAANQLPANTHPLEIQVVALDWKWLFFYPRYGIATVNQVAAPVNVPLKFLITASDVMNSFYIPTLAGQIYAMPRMQTQLSAIIGTPGDYKGISANYSGAGFSQMTFRFLAMTPADFKHWIQAVKSDGAALDRKAYLALAKPSIAEPVRHYAHYAPKLFSDIINGCARPGTLCQDKIMAINEAGGVPLHGSAPPSTAAPMSMSHAAGMH